MKNFYHEVTMKNNGRQWVIIFPLSLTFAVMSSCIPVFDVVHFWGVKNCTNDTILIGHTSYNSIDSVKYFLDSSTDTLYEYTIVKGQGKLEIRGNLIWPDSIGSGEYEGFFLHGKNSEGYLFAIKSEIARKYTWGDICKKKLYDKLIVTWDMLEQNDNLIKYDPENETYGK